MRGLVKPALVVVVGAFICAVGILFSLWYVFHRGLCPALILSGSAIIGGTVIVVLGMKLQSVELFIRKLLEGKGPE